MKRILTMSRYSTTVLSPRSRLGDLTGGGKLGEGSAPPKKGLSDFRLGNPEVLPEGPPDSFREDLRWLEIAFPDVPFPKLFQRRPDFRMGIPEILPERISEMRSLKMQFPRKR